MVKTQVMFQVLRQEALCIIFQNSLWQLKKYFGFEVCRVLLMKVTVFWGMMPCWLVND
jgi:hypothetical protein